MLPYLELAWERARSDVGPMLVNSATTAMGWPAKSTIPHLLPIPCEMHSASYESAPRGRAKRLSIKLNARYLADARSTTYCSLAELESFENPPLEYSFLLAPSTALCSRAGLANCHGKEEPAATGDQGNWRLLVRQLDQSNIYRPPRVLRYLPIVLRK